MKSPLCWKKVLPLLLAMNLATASLAFAGGDHSGGGNTINHDLIEDYAVDYADLKGHDAFEKKLNELREIAPQLADRIKDKLEKTTFYVIPREIAELPAEKTGLHFKSEQDAIQDGREVFINQIGNEARTDEKAGELLMHEALMMSQEKKDARTVRQVLVKLYAKNPDSMAIQNALAVNNFGTYLTSEQKKAVASWSRWSYVEFLRNVAKDANAACEKGMDLRPLRKVLSRGFSNGEEPMDGMISPPAYASTGRVPGFYSPFATRSIYPAIGQMHTLDKELGSNAFTMACMHSNRYLPREVCREVNKYEYDYTSLNRNPEFDAETEMRLSSFYYALSDRENGASKGITDTLDHLTRTPSFLNVIAISMDPKAVREWQTAERPSNDRMKRILHRVEERQCGLDRDDVKAERRLLCNSVSSLQRDLDRLADDEKAGRESGRFDPSWELHRPGREDRPNDRDETLPRRNSGESWVDPAI